MLSIFYHYFEYKPMGLYSRGLIFELYFCQQIIGLIFEGAYNRGGLYSRFYGISIQITALARGFVVFFIHSLVGPEIDSMVE